jgi:hypothetical protein
METVNQLTKYGDSELYEWGHYVNIKGKETEKDVDTQCMLQVKGVWITVT